VIGADTIVAIGSTILGKPKTRKDAVKMLERLSGAEHSVFTGFTIGHLTRKKTVTRVIETRVSFKQLSPREIQWYADTNEPYDKAGGYGIQGIGAFLVKSIQGSYSNVVGLPVCEVMDILQALDIIQLKEKSR